MGDSRSGLGWPRELMASGLLRKPPARLPTLLPDGPGSRPSSGGMQGAPRCGTAERHGRLMRRLDACCLLPSVPAQAPSMSSSSSCFHASTGRGAARKNALSVFSQQANERAKEVPLTCVPGPAPHMPVRSRRSLDATAPLGTSDVATASQAFAKTLTDIESLLSPVEKQVRTVRQDELVEEKLPIQGISYFKMRLPNYPGKATARLQTSSGPLPLLWASTSYKHPDSKNYDVKGKETKLVYEHGPSDAAGSEAARRDLYLSVEAALGQCVYRLVVEFISIKKVVRPTQQNMLARIHELKTDLSKREEFDEHLQYLEERKALRKRQEQSQRKGSVNINGAAAAAEIGQPASSRYSDVESLREALESGDTQLVRARWLLEQAKLKKPLPRRQDLPKEAAFAATDELFRGLAVGPAGEVPPRLLAVSHCWLTPEHPDPQGHHLQNLARFLGPLVEEYGGDMAVFFDWCSLPQKPRKDSEQEAFDRGLSNVDLWYAHRLVWKLFLTKLPPGASAAGYAERGWPHFERSSCSFGAESGAVLDLGLLPQAPARAHQLLQVCRAERQQPALPDDFATTLQSKHFSNGKTDCDLLVKKYREVFQVLGGVP